VAPRSDRLASAYPATELTRSEDMATVTSLLLLALLVLAVLDGASALFARSSSR